MISMAWFLVRDFIWCKFSVQTCWTVTDCWMLKIMDQKLIRISLADFKGSGPELVLFHSEIRTTYRMGPERTWTRNPGPNAGPVSKRFKGQLRSIPETFVLLTPWCLIGKMCANWLSIFGSLYSNNFKFILQNYS